MRECDERFEALVRSHARFVEDADAVDADSPIVTLGIDSMATVELLGDLEDTFGVVFPDEFLTAETFATPRTIWRALSTLL